MLVEQLCILSGQWPTWVDVNVTQSNEFSQLWHIYLIATRCQDYIWQVLTSNELVRNWIRPKSGLWRPTALKIGLLWVLPSKGSTLFQCLNIQCWNNVAVTSRINAKQRWTNTRISTLEQFQDFNSKQHCFQVEMTLFQYWNNIEILTSFHQENKNVFFSKFFQTFHTLLTVSIIVSEAWG